MRKPFGQVTRAALQAALGKFTGECLQLPPMYSALKHKGRPYYEYARKGESIPRTARPVRIHSIRLDTFDPPYWEARVVCSRGTYIRTLVEDIAESLGSCATMIELVRDRIGPYASEQALTWQELRSISREDLTTLLQPVSELRIPAHA